MGSHPGGRCVNAGQSPVFSGYDIIGDVHGCAHALQALLEKMGYEPINGIYRHQNRQAIFVGDVIDRGPRIREALRIVRDMVEAGSAQMVMGNHEYNALGYCTRARPGSPHTYLREHTARHNRTIEQTLKQFEQHPLELQAHLDWFLSLPLFLEMPGFRVVHACWDDELIQAYKNRYGRATIDMDFLHDSSVPGSFAGRVMDRLLRGTDLPLPDGLTIKGGDGYIRKHFRTRFWARDPRTYADVVFQPDALPGELASRELSAEERRKLLCYPESAPPVFVGHYWLSGRPELLRPNVACLDYSAVKYGSLVAYRFDGETALSADKFVWVDVEPKRFD
ncbi:MAG: serine/threonine protein phosphatase [Gammaproteobacteria bacterium]|nr:MAG: serine/threonine protein phosphatase [Gammaproteobacteria bacterium]